MAQPIEAAELERAFAQPPAVYQFQEARVGLNSDARPMRALAMADGGIDPHAASGFTPWIAAISGIGAAIVAALGGWLANSALGKAALENIVTARLELLLNEREEDYKRTRDDLDTLRQKFEAAEIKWDAERADLKGEIRGLRQLNESLNRALERLRQTGANP